MAAGYGNHSVSEMNRTDSMEESLRAVPDRRVLYGASLTTLSQTILVAMYSTIRRKQC